MGIEKKVKVFSKAELDKHCKMNGDHEAWVQKDSVELIVSSLEEQCLNAQLMLDDADNFIRGLQMFARMLIDQVDELEQSETYFDIEVPPELRAMVAPVKKRR